MYTLVTGGLRSGKSEYALRRASELGPPPWLWVGPHIEGDDDLKRRLKNHRRDQEATWKLVDSGDRFEDALTPENLAGVGSFVLDRITIWVSNRLARSEENSDHDLLAEVERLADRLYRSTVPAVVVTTEVGLGFLPANVPDRRLIDV